MQIRDKERLLAQQFDASALHVPGYRARVALFANKRKKRRDGAAEAWLPASGEIRISFEPLTGETGTEAPEASSSDPTPGNAPLQQLLCDLALAENQPGHAFVALKWFRDAFLPQRSHAWTTSPTERDRWLRQAVAEGLVLTSRVPNPRHSQFPTTALRLNRAHPTVVAWMGGAPAARGLEFSPVEIPGEPLSESMLRERG